MLGLRGGAAAPGHKPSRRLDRQLVAEAAEAGDRSVSHGREHRYPTPGLSRIRVREMKLHDHTVEGRQRVGKGPTRMRERTGVDHDRVRPAASGMNSLYQVRFALWLQMPELTT